MIPMITDEQAEKRYTKYRKEIEETGSLPITEEPTITSLKLSKSRNSMIYKDMKADGFIGHGNLIDYIRWIALQRFITLWEDSMWGLLHREGKIIDEKPTEVSMKVVLECLLERLERHPTLSNNIIKLILKNINFLYESLNWEYYQPLLNVDSDTAKYLLFKTIMAFYFFKIYEKPEIKDVITKDILIQ